MARARRHGAMGRKARDLCHRLGDGARLAHNPATNEGAIRQ
jgi:hypothetical protein